jgi:threonyl-tRNA synthetase
VSKQVRDAELRKIPYLLVVGDRELQDDQVSLRQHGQGDRGTVAVDDVISQLGRQVNRRSRA